jgi:transcriptional regulator with GAF, ATPase, and Fis domain
VTRRTSGETRLSTDQNPPPSRTRDPDKTEAIGLRGERPTGLTLRSVVWTVLEGPQKGRQFRVERDPISVGSAADNTLVLADPTVSRHHAEVLSVQEGFLVRDLGSTNGTMLDGNRVKEAFISPGCRLKFGSTTLGFQPRSEQVLIPPEDSDHFGGLYGKSLVMRQLFGILKRIAPTDVTIVLKGETGTGKEVASRAIHAASHRATGPLSILDCSSVDRGLVSSELFGHEEGAFTGAISARPGAFEQAHSGTLFIDELGELPLDLQAKLLRAMEQREVRRLGGNKAIRIDCRIIAATHRDLPAMVKAGQFREDLYYRFAQVVVRLPSLRDRREDIPLLADRILNAHPNTPGATRLSSEALEVLMRCEFPGNVRELRNVLDRARALAAGPEITPAELLVSSSVDEGAEVPEPVAAPPTAAPELESPAAGAFRLSDAEHETIVRALQANHYHRELAAQQLGISLPTLRDRIRRYGIEVPKRSKLLKKP